MNQPNAAGKTLRQLLEQTRSQWHADEQRMRRIDRERAAHPDM
jgi:hypothetical protein